MAQDFLRAAGGALALALLLASPACDPNGSASTVGASPTPSPSASSTPTGTPAARPTSTPTPAPKPFFPALAAVGGQSFAQVIGAPVGSVCTVKALLKPSGTDISGIGLKPRAVTVLSQGASWSSDKDQLFKPGVASGQLAHWQFMCTNTAYNPSSKSKISDFDFTTP